MREQHVLPHLRKRKETKTRSHGRIWFFSELRFLFGVWWRDELMTPLILFLPLFAPFPPQDCFCSPRMPAWLAGLVLPSCALQIISLCRRCKTPSFHIQTDEPTLKRKIRTDNINLPPPAFQCPVWKYQQSSSSTIKSFNKIFQTTAVSRLLCIALAAQDKGADAVQ